MSNYPPTPRFGGGFVPRPPPPSLFTAQSRGYGYQQSSRVQSQQPTSATVSISSLSSQPLVPYSDLKGDTGKAGLSSGMNGIQNDFDREEGEVSDVEGDLGPNTFNDRTISSIRPANPSFAQFKTPFSLKESSGLTNDGASINGVISQIPGLSSATVQQDFHVPFINSTSEMLNSESVTQSMEQGRNEVVPTKQSSTCNVARYDDIRKRAEAAVLNLLPLKVTFKDMVDEGISEKVLRRVFVKIGLPVPSEDESISQQKASTSARKEEIDSTKSLYTLNNGNRVTLEEKAEQFRKRLEEEKMLTQRRLTEEKQRKEREAREREAREREAREREAREREAREREAREREARERETREREAREREVREREAREHEAREREVREREAREHEAREHEAREREATKEREAPEKLKEELCKEEERKKREGLAREDAQAKKELVRRKADGLNLPPKPPPPVASCSSAASLPQEALPTSDFNIPPSTVFSTSPVMIPGLLLDNMDLGPRFPETPISAQTPPINDNLSANNTHITSSMTLPVATTADGPINHASTVPFISDAKVTPRRKRPVAADFDDDNAIASYIPPVKRRFGSVREDAFIYHLTDDEEDEDVHDRKPNTSLVEHLRETRNSRSPPNFGRPGDQHQPNGKDRNINTPPGLLSDAIESAKQLKETEEKIRKLRVTIQLMQEKKKKVGTEPGTEQGTLTRVSPARTQTSTAVLSKNGSPLPTINSPSETGAIAENLMKPASTSSDFLVLPPEATLKLQDRNDNSGSSTPSIPTISMTSSVAFQHETKPKIQLVLDSKTKEEIERLRAILLAKRKPEVATTSKSGVTSEPTPSGVTSAPTPSEETTAPPVEIPKDESPDSESTPVIVEPEFDRREADEVRDQPMKGTEQTETQDGSGYESPPYEPSLGDVEVKNTPPKMDIDRGEEESVEMEVDSSDDGKEEERITAQELAQEAGVLNYNEQKSDSLAFDKQQSLSKCISTTVSELMADLSSSTQTESNKTPIQGAANVTKVVGDGGLANLEDMSVVSLSKTIPHTYTEYESPLRQFRSYRYHPSFLDMVPGGYRSWTFSHRIDPDKEFCFYELNGGKCNDLSCQMQHFREISLSDDEILVELGSVFEGESEADRAAYREGLRNVIQDMRASKVSDFQTVAVEIARYRTKFFNDPTRVVRLTKAETLV